MKSFLLISPMILFLFQKKNPTKKFRKERYTLRAASLYVTEHATSAFTFITTETRKRTSPARSLLKRTSKTFSKYAESKEKSAVKFSRSNTHRGIGFQLS